MAPKILIDHPERVGSSKNFVERRFKPSTSPDAITPPTIMPMLSNLALRLLSILYHSFHFFASYSWTVALIAKIHMPKKERGNYKRYLVGRLWYICYNILYGALAEQLRSGLQNRVDGCNSHRCLQKKPIK
mgnify:CR=1 FL=1